jgi:hypothetical protein
MRLTTPLLGAAIGAGLNFRKDIAKGALWGAGIGLLVTMLGGAAISVGGINIRVGVDDSDVSKVQAMLNQIGFHVPTDGALGQSTIAALKQFQRNMGLHVDGSVSPETLTALRSLAMPGPTGGAPWLHQTGVAFAGYGYDYGDPHWTGWDLDPGSNPQLQKQLEHGIHSELTSRYKAHQSQLHQERQHQAQHPGPLHQHRG